MSAESSNPSWSRMKWSDDSLDVYWAESNIPVSQGLHPKGSEEPSVWVSGAHEAAANSPRPRVAHQVNREQKGLFQEH